MALSEAFLEELRARTPLAEIIGRRVRLSRAGRQWRGCCPFHGEKTASFYVYDDHYHCFGCGAHGDAVSFVMQTQGLEFMEAVEQLAAAAALAVPKASPAAAEADRARRDLGAILEAAARSFQRQLLLPQGKAALSYLLKRGLTRTTIETFGVGWSGSGRGELIGEFSRQGITPDRLVSAGLVKPGDSGDYRDFFFNRIMFPIRDRRGRIVSFGGRALGEGQPKYLNGPETEVFAKRRTLYGIDRIGKGRAQERPVVVEGYMDVIALYQSGFTSAVAPLGTALTEEQLGVLWRYAPAPIICFDGDAAGARATERVIELALPELAPNRTLSFVRLPEGEDPDSLVQQGGAGVLRTLLAEAVPLFRALYDVARHRTGEATPEQRASLRAYLEAAAERIHDRGLAHEYHRGLRDLFFTSRSHPSSALRRHDSLDPPAIAGERQRQLIAILLRQPSLFPVIEEDFGKLGLVTSLARLRSAIFEWCERAEALDSESLLAHLDAVGLKEEVRVALAPVPLPVCAAGITLAEARARWREIFELLMSKPRLEEDLAQAGRAFVENPDPTVERRVVARKEELDAVRRGERS